MRKINQLQTAGLGGVATLILFIVAYIVTGGEIVNRVPPPEPVVAPGGGIDAGFGIEEVATRDDWYEIYFTDPQCPPEEERIDGIDAIIAADLLAAEAGVDLAGFEIESPVIVDALIELEQRGLPVRVVTDTDYGDEFAVRRLRRNGISVVEDKNSALMHNKFIVIDGFITWTGSMNFTLNGAYCNNNNMVRFLAPELARNYRAEMDEMYDSRQFGPSSPPNTRYEKVSIHGVPVENYFAPETKVVPRILSEIGAAKEEILFLAFSFTHEDIGEAMIDRAEDGLIVRGVFETTGSESSYSYFDDMTAAGLPNLQVRQDGNPRIMHHKVIIIDRRLAIFGSFNFSRNANRFNDENIVFVHDPAFASYFVEEFEWVWQEAAPPSSAPPSSAP